MAPSLQSVSLTRGTTLHSADFPHHKPLGPRLPSQPRGPTGSLGRPAHTVPGPCDDKERGSCCQVRPPTAHTHTTSCHHLPTAPRFHSKEKVCFMHAPRFCTVFPLHDYDQVHSLGFKKCKTKQNKQTKPWPQKNVKIPPNHCSIH